MRPRQPGESKRRMSIETLRTARGRMPELARTSAAGNREAAGIGALVAASVFRLACPGQSQPVDRARERKQRRNPGQRRLRLAQCSVSQIRLQWHRILSCATDRLRVSWWHRLATCAAEHRIRMVRTAICRAGVPLGEPASGQPPPRRSSKWQAVTCSDRNRAAPRCIGAPYTLNTVCAGISVTNHWHFRGRKVRRFPFARG
jgi:hypothetical protein